MHFLQVLAVILNLRRRLAAEHGAASYAGLILCGSCLGSPASAAALLAQLQPVLSQHAAAELAELQQLAARRARAAGRCGNARNLWLCCLSFMLPEVQVLESG